MSRPTSEKAVREALRREAKKQGSITALARSWSMCRSQISDVINGHQAISAKMAQRAGFRKVVRWERIH